MACCLLQLSVLLLFLSLARSYRKTGISHPKGIQSFLEPVILFVRDDIAIPNIGHKYEKYMPYLLTAFFFILINNLMGLIPFPPPFGANVTGNIAITFFLAICTFLITQFSGNKSHWRHVFATPGVPFWLLPIMIPVEIIGLFSKPFALMIRLFANMLAGHIVILSLICLIFIFDSLGTSSGINIICDFYGLHGTSGSISSGIYIYPAFSTFYQSGSTGRSLEFLFN